MSSAVPYDLTLSRRVRQASPPPPVERLPPSLAGSLALPYGAINIELGALAAADVPDGPITVMCGHGERAMTGASLLAARGHRDVNVLDGGPDEWAACHGSSLTVT